MFGHIYSITKWLSLQWPVLFKLPIYNNYQYVTNFRFKQATYFFQLLCCIKSSLYYWKYNTDFLYANIIHFERLAPTCTIDSVERWKVQKYLDMVRVDLSTKRRHQHLNNDAWYIQLIQKMVP